MASPQPPLNVFPTGGMQPKYDRRDPLMFNPVYDVFRSTAVRNALPKYQQLITAGTSDTIASVVDRMARHNVGACLVFAGREFKGIVDNASLLRHLLANVPGYPGDVAMRHPGDLEAVSAIRNATLGDAMATTALNTEVALDTDPLSKIARKFSKGRRHIAIQSADTRDITNVISRLDVIRFLEKHLKGNAEVFASTVISDLVAGRPEARHLQVVTSKATVVEALDKLVKHGISGLAVVDEQGRLEGNFSTGDLKGVFVTDLLQLSQPVGLFLKQHAPSSMNPVIVTEGCKLRDVIENMLMYNIHRVWVCDAAKTPVAVFSDTDIMSLIKDFRLKRHHDKPATLESVMDSVASLCGDLVDDLHSVFHRMSTQPPWEQPHTAIPRMNVLETTAGWSFLICLPGCKKADVSVDLNGEVMTVTGLPRAVTEAKTHATLILQEQAFEDRFIRSFTLPELANPASVESKFHDGLLTITVQRLDRIENLRKRITIE